MMPIVDALMHLPAGSSCTMSAKESLDDYLAQHTEFHVLRALAVQPKMVFAESYAHAQLIRTLATTRGSGGLPNGLLVHAALDDSADNSLHSHMAQMQHRGIAVQIDDKPRTQSDIENSSIIRNCAELESTKAVVNIGITEMSQTSCNTVIALIKRCNALPFVFQFDDTFIANATEEQVNNFFTEYSNFNNAYITLAGLHDQQHDVGVEKLTARFNQIINIFGYERVMFGSNYPNQTPCGSYDALWRTYSAATAGISATNRDKLFRSNALGLYRL